MKPDGERERQYRSMRESVNLSTVGLTMALSVAVGAVIGYLLDRWLRTNWLVIVFTLVGVGAGFRELFRAVIRANREEERNEAERREQDRRE